MANLTVSAAHSILLMPINRLSKFAVIKNGVMLVMLAKPDDAHAIPGSIKITDDNDDSTVKKTITYKRRIIDRTTANLLDGYRATRLIAIYTDEVGNRRVAGSPDFPLKFSYTTDDGVFSCKLEGEGSTIDPFLI